MVSPNVVIRVHNEHSRDGVVISWVHRDLKDRSGDHHQRGHTLIIISLPRPPNAMVAVALKEEDALIEAWQFVYSLMIAPCWHDEEIN